MDKQFFFKEGEIPPWSVALEHDGCLRGFISMPQGWGTMQECAQFIANHIAPRDYELAIYPTDGGRLRSFMIPAPTVARRIRLTIQDFDPA